MKLVHITNSRLSHFAVATHFTYDQTPISPATITEYSKAKFKF